MRQTHQTMHAVTQLWHLMDEVAGARDEAEIFDIVMRMLHSTLNVERANVMLCAPDGSFRSVAQLGLSEHACAELTQLQTATGSTAALPRLINDVAESEDTRAHLALLRAEDVAAVATIPMAFGENVLGRIALYYREPHEFEDREIAVARALASHVAFALEHRRMHRELNEAHDELNLKLKREREARQRVHESESRLRLALDAGEMGTWDWSVRTGEVIWSPELQIIHGLEPGTFDGTFEAFKRDVHPEDVERVLTQIRDTLAGEADDYRIEYRLVTPGGEQRWIEACGRLVRDEEDNPIRLVGICANITERKRREELQNFLSDAADVLATSLLPEETLENIARIAVPRVADWCTIHLENDQGEILPVATAHSDPELVELARAAQMRWSVKRDSADGVAMVLRTGQSVLVPHLTPEMVRNSAHDDEHRALLEGLQMCSVMLVPLRSGTRVFGSLALISSESQRIYNEQDLRAAQQLADRAALAVENSRLYAEATRAARARDEMIALVSHDLRNPINTIATACALQELPVPPEKKARALASIKRAARTMESLIQNLLDVARIDAHELTIERRFVDVGEVIEEACSLILPVAEHDSISLEKEVDPNLPRIHGDTERLLQVMANLLGNALKFVSEGGHIRVSATRCPGGVEIAVADSGIGIKRDQLPHLFDRFWQANRYGRTGTGLGLAIVKGIVDAHEGEISVESIPGRGSTFRVRLPAADQADNRV